MVPPRSFHSLPPEGAHGCLWGGPAGAVIMLSRTADHLFWMSRYMERAVQARSACGAARIRRVRQHAAGFSAGWELPNAQ